MSDRMSTRASIRKNHHPFSGLRVLDFGIGGVGVEISRLFAEYGADVIKVESRNYPDFIRGIDGGVMAPSFASSSRSKRSLGVNLKAERGRQLLYELAKISDLVVENSARGVMERMGVGYETLKHINPRIIMVSSQLMGASGPWSAWTGYGPSTHTVSGLTTLWNYRGETKPSGSQNIYPDHLVPRVAAFAVVAALLERERTGVGCHVEVAQFETPIGLLGDLFLQESLFPGTVTPQGNESPRGAPWGAYPCQGDDAWCVINVRNDQEWAGLRAALGDPEWARKPELDSVLGRIRQRAYIDEQLTAWTSQRPPQEVMATLQAHGVPAGVVESPADQATDPHLAARGYLRRVDQPLLGPIIMEGPAFRGTNLADPVIEPAPNLGEHTRQICAELLGLDQTEIDQLISEGVLEEPELTEAAAT